MKIKNKFIIPVIAIMVALVMTGAPVATVAADTTPSDDSTTEITTTDPRWTHPYSNTTTTEPTTADLDATINSVVSGIFGDNAGEIGGEIGGAVTLSTFSVNAQTVELVSRAEAPLPDEFPENPIL